MATLQAVRILPEPLRVILGVALVPGYNPIQGPLNFPSRVFAVQNTTDATILISFNGIDDHIFLPENSSFNIDVAANKSGDAGLFIASQTQIYAAYAGGAPTQGAIVVTSFYGVPL